jgi:hypothetical protein
MQKKVTELLGPANSNRRLLLSSVCGCTVASSLLQHLCRQEPRTRHLRDRAIPLLYSKSAAQFQYLVRPRSRCGATRIPSVSISTREDSKNNHAEDLRLHLTLLYLDGNLHWPTAQRRTLHVPGVPLPRLECCDWASHRSHLPRFDQPEGAHWQDSCKAQASRDHDLYRLFNQYRLTSNPRNGDSLQSPTPDLSSTGGAWNGPSWRHSLSGKRLVPVPFVVLPAKQCTRQIHQERVLRSSAWRV